MLEKENWFNVIKIDVDGKPLEFINIVIHYFNAAFPNKNVVISNVYNKSSKLITKGIINLCKTKKQLYKLCQKTNDANLKLYYKTYTIISRKLFFKQNQNPI